jgi:Trehalose-6-phosphate synthase
MGRVVRRGRPCARAVSQGWAAPDPGGSVARGDPGVLRGFQQRDALADLPRRDRPGDLPPHLVEHLPDGQPPLRPGHRRGGRAGCHGLGARLPAAAGSRDGQLRPDVRIGWFNHIPFPPVELFAQLPWRRSVVEGLLGADFLGFQRTADAQNFLRVCHLLLGMATKADTVTLTPPGDDLCGTRTAKSSPRTSGAGRGSADEATPLARPRRLDAAAGGTWAG